MKFPSYPKYKDSGVEWLGEVPEHWGRSKLGFETTVKARLGWKGLKAEEYVSEGCIFLATPNIKHNAIDFENVNYITIERYEESPEIMLKVGDVLVTKDGSTTGTTNVVRTLPGETTVNSSIAVIRPGARVDSIYLNYWFISKFIQTVIKKMLGGMGVPHLFQEDLRRFDLLLPPLPEQQAIAAFLDAQTAKIDTLIAKKRELIDKLKEKRAALITRTVTRGLPPEAAKAAGLDPNPRMKDSGVEWLGEVPEHWEVKKLSFLFYFIKGRNAAQLTKEYIGDNPGEYPVYSGQTENDGLMGFVDSYELNIVDFAILVTTVGAKAMTTRMVSGQLSLSQNCALLMRRMSSIVSRYYGNALLPLFVHERRSISLIMQPSLRFEDLNRFRVPLPPSNEQSKIADYLNRETAKLDALATKVETAIERLQEYRSALITAAVTGKIDVREAAQ